MSESKIQVDTRLAFSLYGPIWRNNSGVMINEKGRHVRFGLGNESKALNEKIKSSDLIGIMPVTITPEMVGQRLGVFVALECKPPDWTLQPGDKRALAQKKFHDIVQANGGFAGFVKNPNDVHSIICESLKK